MIFDKWEEDVKIEDAGLQKYLVVAGTRHSHGRMAEKQFEKSKVSLVERMINSIMRSGSQKKLGGHFIRDRKGCGKKTAAYDTVKKAFEIIEKRSKENPVQVLVNAVENAAPREETTRVRMGGITRHIAVDTSPQRRVDIALRNLALGAMSKCFKKKKNRAEALAEEIIAAANEDNASVAINKKTEIERVAKGAR